MTDTPNLALPYIYAAQAQKHVTHNEALRGLDCLVQLAVASRSLASPPASPAEGARYVVAASPSGAWAGKAGHVAAYQDGAWAFYVPQEGWIAWAADEMAAIIFTSGTWTLLPANGVISDHGALSGLADDDHPQYLNVTRGDARYLPLAPSTVGINASASTTNRLAVASPASLFDHAGNGHQMKLNKQASSDTASVLFQTGYSGRAEMGTAGDDDFHFKVSPDGSAWTEALKVDKSTGDVTFPATGQVNVQRFTSSGTWTKPPGAKLCRVVVTGGGGGGGGGGKAATSTALSGGGGGGGGGRSESLIDASSLGATETVTVGAGGSIGGGATSNGPGGNGSAGGTSAFGIWISAYGGGGGSGGDVSTASGGGAGGGQRAAGLNASGGTGGSAGSSLSGTSGGSGATAANATLPTGGAGGGGCSSAGTAGAGAASVSACGGGGSGGGVTSGNVFKAGGHGYDGYSTGANVGGASDGAAGTSGGTETTRGALGAGGGAGSVSANGGNGGSGGPPGGGGGGGGGSQGGNGGAGGAGGRGEVLVITWR